MNHDIVVALLVVAAISLVLGPVYWLRPSPRQKQLARLRAYALELGLRPEQRQVPAVMRHCGYPDSMIKYQWFRPEADWPTEGPAWMAFFDAQADGGGRFIWLRSSGYSAGPDALLAGLRGVELPGGMIAVEADASGVGVYWHEAGDRSQVERLLELLKTWPLAYCHACAAQG